MFKFFFSILTGSIPPISVFTYENYNDSDYLANLQINAQIALTITANGIFTIHSLPNWNIISSSQITRTSVSCLSEDSKITTIISTRPFVYNTSFQIISALKRAPIRTGEQFTSISVSNNNNLLISCTNCGTICLWDYRANTTPEILTLPRNLNFCSLSTVDNTIAFATRNSRVHVFDNRYLSQPFSKHIIDLTSSIKGNETLSEFFSGGHSSSIDGICLSPEEPWKLAFQYNSGQSGIIDLMTNFFDEINPTPPQAIGGTLSLRYQKMSPVFSGGHFCYGFSWSNVIQCESRQISIPITPIAISSHPHWDGVFTASFLGDVLQVF